jgi:hypothetical protein
VRHMIWPEKIYLAAAYERNEEMRGVRDVLEAIGYKVTSRWIDQHEGEVPVAIGGDSLNANPEAHYRYADIDIADLRAANVVVSFLGAPGRGGHHIEFGLAVAWSKHLVVVGQRENVFHALPGVDWYPDWPHLMMALQPRPSFADLL